MMVQSVWTGTCLLLCVSVVSGHTVVQPEDPDLERKNEAVDICNWSPSVEEPEDTGPVMPNDIAPPEPKDCFAKLNKYMEHTSKNTVVLFYTEWCQQDSQALEPQHCALTDPFHEVAKNFPFHKPTFVKVDLEQHEEVKAGFDIQKVPTMRLFAATKNGRWFDDYEGLPEAVKMQQWVSEQVKDFKFFAKFAQAPKRNALVDDQFSSSRRPPALEGQVPLKKCNKTIDWSVLENKTASTINASQPNASATTTAATTTSATTIMATTTTTEQEAPTHKATMSCAELGKEDPRWKNGRGSKVGGVCANSYVMEGQCSGRQTFAAAQDICEANKARLCTFIELDADVTHGTGCRYDSKRVWSSTPCDGGDKESVWTTAGSHIKKVKAPKECTPKEQASAVVRCCSDEDVGRPEDDGFVQ